MIRHVRTRGDRPIRRRAILSVLVLAAAACRPDADQRASRNETASPVPVVTPTPSPDPTYAPTEFAVPRDGHGRYEMRSTVHGVYFTAIDHVPHIVPVPRSFSSGCVHGDHDPLKTAGANAARALGWMIIDEAPLGRLTAVTMARGFYPPVGARCYEIDGVVALFEGARPIAVLRRTDTTGIGMPTGLGSLDQVAPGELNVGLSFVSGPVGRLSLEGNRLRFGTIPPSDTYCHGRVGVPNLYGMRLPQMRRTLLLAGWRPHAMKPDKYEDEDFTRYQRRRYPETEQCGTRGGCSYRYHRADAELSVYTNGDEDPDAAPGDYDNRIPIRENDIYLDYTVLGYDVTCRVRRAR